MAIFCLISSFIDKLIYFQSFILFFLQETTSNMTLRHLVLCFTSATTPHHSKLTMPHPASAWKGKSTQDTKPSSKAYGWAKQTSDDNKDTTGNLKAVSHVT
jgi:hypothetical protein